jgi:HSP90 family molecular chaperone
MIVTLLNLKFFGTQSSEKPLSHSHFKAEGDVEFRSILYIPERTPFNYYDNYYSNDASIKLYVRRVFISDDFKEMLPKCVIHHCAFHLYSVSGKTGTPLRVC